MAGLDWHNNWHVLEAKGRSRSVSTVEVLRAKNQAGRVNSIYGLVPDTTSASVVRLFTNPISVLLDDPDDENQTDTHWEIDPQTFVRLYYAPIKQYLEILGTETYNLQNLEFDVAQFSDDYMIGLLSTFRTQDVVTQEWTRLMQDIKALIGTNELQSLGLGLDGIVLLPSRLFREEII
ncbi:MAG: hypothetical protein P9X24_18020 [Candidatus Hatepunaea meridiana]|nr:hypothetical protein [Candidatus Hatepunaea meridiana]